ncbi:MAG: IS200/IS605 family transposase [Candidatus Pacebacteria bacterium]|nr:IS200/IS605 family transposase [Candidatus Paceibacterota bacterium]
MNQFAKHWEIVELNIQEDHIHFCLLATPRDSISYIMQIIKGKSSAWMKKKIKRVHGLYEKESLWARGYFVSTIGLDENLIKRYVNTNIIITKLINHLCLRN